MPELPEVETIRRDLEGRILGRRITAVRIPPDTGKPVPVLKGIDEAAFREGVVGARIEAVERRGKYLVLRLDTGLLLVVHLRMTGALLHRRADAEPDRFLRAVLALDDGTELRFTDLRKFGGFWLVEDVVEVDDRPRPGAPQRRLHRRPPGRRRSPAAKRPSSRSSSTSAASPASATSTPTKPASPPASTPAASAPTLDAKPRSRPCTPRCATSCCTGVESRGASFRDYHDADGKHGSMQMHVKVFRRTGKPCYTCGTVIERVKVGGRSTHYCPKCQR